MSHDSMDKPLFNRTVLVVDDAPDSLSLISDTLDQVGINTLVALDGKQALSIVKSIRPDLVLLDAIMPQMDGFETCRQMKAISGLAATPVMFMTGLSDTESVVKGLNAGGVDYLTKPIKPAELIARMEVHLGNAMLAQSAHQALDTLGQLVFMTDQNGDLEWATPECHGLLARIDWKKNQNKIRRWLHSSPTPSSRLILGEGDDSVEIHFVEKREPNRLLYRIEINSQNAGPKTLQREFRITKRESEVLFWLANGKSNKDIAAILGISVRTANKHLEQIFPKLGVENRTAAAGMAIRKLS